MMLHVGKLCGTCPCRFLWTALHPARCAAPVALAAPPAFLTAMCQASGSACPHLLAAELVLNLQTQRRSLCLRIRVSPAKQGNHTCCKEPGASSSIPTSSKKTAFLRLMFSLSGSLHSCNHSASHPAQTSDLLRHGCRAVCRAAAGYDEQVHQVAATNSTHQTSLKMPRRRRHACITL